MNAEQKQHLQENGFISGPEIGKGNYGTVFRCTDVNTHVNYAVKVVNLKLLKMRPNFNLDRLLREVHVMQQLNHPNIVRLYKVLQTTNYVLLIMELVLGMELFDLIMAKNGLQEQEAMPIFYQLCSALLYMHSKGIVHRDIKPENILLQGGLSTPGVKLDEQVKNGFSNPSIKLVDFGLSKMLGEDGSGAKSIVGTPRYIAPEIQNLSRELNERPNYGTEIDCYSSGVLLHVMLGACFPQFKQGVVVFVDKRIARISPKAKDLITRLMAPRPTERMKMKDALTHPWFQQLFPNEPVTEVLRKVSARELQSFEEFKHKMLDGIDAKIEQERLTNTVPPIPIQHIKTTTEPAQQTEGNSSPANVQSHSPRLRPQNSISPENSLPETNQPDNQQGIKRTAETAEMLLTRGDSLHASQSKGSDISISDTMPRRSFVSQVLDMSSPSPQDIQHNSPGNFNPIAQTTGNSSPPYGTRNTHSPIPQDQFSTMGNQSNTSSPVVKQEHFDETRNVFATPNTKSNLSKSQTPGSSGSIQHTSLATPSSSIASLLSPMHTGSTESIHRSTQDINQGTATYADRFQQSMNQYLPGQTNVNPPTPPIPQQSSQNRQIFQSIPHQITPATPTPHISQNWRNTGLPPTVPFASPVQTSAPNTPDIRLGGTGRTHSPSVTGQESDVAPVNEQVFVPSRQEENTHAIIDPGQLLSLQCQIADCFRESWLACKDDQQVAPAVRKSAVASRDLMQASAWLLKKLEQTSISVSDLLPDLEIAVEEGEFQMAFTCFKTIKGWIQGLKKEANDLLERNLNVMTSVNESIELARSRHHRLNRVTNVLENMVLDQTSVSNGMTTSNSDENISELPGNHSADQTQKLQQLIGVVNDAITSGEPLSEDQMLNLTFPVVDIVPKGERISTTNQTANNNEEQNIVRPGSPTQHMSRVLDMLKEVDQLLQHHASFWSQMEVVVDVLMQRAEHIEGMVNFTRNPRLRGRFKQRMDEYDLMWKRVMFMCERFNTGRNPIGMYKFLYNC